MIPLDKKKINKVKVTLIDQNTTGVYTKGKKKKERNGVFF